MQDRSSIISCFLVLFLFCFYQKKIQNFRRSLIKSQVCGLESEACLQLSRSRLNHLHCQLEAFGSWPELPKNVFFLSYSLPFCQALTVSSFAKSNENQSLLCKPSWSSRAMFGHKSSGACGGRPGGDFSQARTRQGPPHHAVMKGRIKRPSQSQAPSDSPWLNIVHSNKHHCEFAVCLLVDTLPLPSKFDACMDVFRSSWTLFDQLQSEANFLLYSKIWHSIVSAQHFR